jgi:hypothetical protein
MSWLEGWKKAMAKHNEETLKTIDDLLKGNRTMSQYTLFEDDIKYDRPNDKQHGGSHYKGKAIQPWDYVIANNMGYLDGTAVKYITRYKEKNGVEDLKKAIHFLEKLIEVEEKNAER